ncbi:HAMP domain-containing sensor histidine kinase [Sphingomonas sp. 10B4]|uniref:sensor histidine kinase n=1 Tax=Sphingomonas sp. 10B4 TaxID=3048575 RepID=UPI002AB439CC|nr:HAMP domain-containing sensor histidine kinase [Sphingomonas sp. 10B4]MDY7524589.1 HAMP domain-containing sensor histidine kinase [Sphingomonas sp. 10B4]MEB0283998.1 HAMP domain-containing sensor histidine kinase [Sphingomonas sp. 10B4]
MKWSLESLRGRLIAGMLFMFLLGLGGAFALGPLERQAQAIRGTDYFLFQDPYQDILILLPFSFGAILLIWFVSGWSLRHLASASREAAIVGPGNPVARITTERLPEEVRPLVNAINGALDRLTEAYHAEQRFVADAAHELRTPLAVLGLHLQRAKLGGTLHWATIDDDLAQLNRLVGQLLDLARKEHARQADAVVDEPVVNLSRNAREAAAAVFPLAEREGRELDIELPDSLEVRGRPDDLRDMVRNLLENAIIHGRGRIRLVGEVRSALGSGRQALITVSDEGPGVAPALGEAVFDRFRKGSPDSVGHGLGLAIVREVVLGHEGSVEFLVGPTCRARIMLPMADAPSSRS